MANRIIFDRNDRPHVVTDSALVTMHTERQVNGKTVYGQAQYTALETRPATSEEFNAWRDGK